MLRKCFQMSQTVVILRVMNMQLSLWKLNDCTRHNKIRNENSKLLPPTRDQHINLLTVYVDIQFKMLVGIKPNSKKQNLWCCKGKKKSESKAHCSRPGGGLYCFPDKAAVGFHNYTFDWFLTVFWDRKGWEAMSPFSKIYRYFSWVVYTGSMVELKKNQ